MLEVHRRSVAFESSWQSGGRPRIEDFLPADKGPLRSELFRSLLTSELELRHDADEEFSEAEYLARFPDEQASIGQIFAEALASDGASTAGTGLDSGRLQIAHYIVEREINRGGMGVVYRARDERLGRFVAIKVILSGHLASLDELRRFEIEASGVARLDHPGVVPVFEFGEWAGHRYLVMPLVDGSNLAELISAGPLPVQRGSTWAAR